MNERLGLLGVPAKETDFDEAIAKIRKIHKFQADVLDLLIENGFTYGESWAALMYLARAISGTHDEVMEEEEENEEKNEKSSCGV